MKFVYIEAYGCSANISEYEILSGLLLKEGFKIADNPSESDINIILTCVVKTPTSNRMAYRIKKLSELNKPLIVAGCMPEVEYERIKSISPGISLISTNHLKQIPKLINRIMEGEKVELRGRNNEIKICSPKIRKNPVVNIVQISSGCKSSCSYCCVKLAKGNLFSYPPEMIVKDIEKSVREGCREIWITSQDNSCYGFDTGMDLVELLGRITQIKGNFRVRVGMMNPSHLGPIIGRLTEVYKSPKIYKFIHIPVQSGSDKILRLMRRGYTVKDFKEIVDKFRESIPDLTLSTDIIVGFPGETEKDFERTLSLVRRIRPDVVNVSKFGPRPGTDAVRMKRLDDMAVKQRSTKLAHLVRKMGLEKNMEWVGKECEVLVAERGKKKNQFAGRNESYKPVVVESEENLIGRILKVRIAGAGQTYLIPYPVLLESRHETAGHSNQ
jgi:MiaB-like tRNA modifying enzyme